MKSMNYKLADILYQLHSKNMFPNYCYNKNCHIAKMTDIYPTNSFDHGRSKKTEATFCQRNHSL